jgi:hypothetical protein
MLTQYDPSKETAADIAKRKWRNNAVRQKIIEKREQKPKLVEEAKDPEIAETVINEGRRDGAINRLESKFKREIREMLQGDADRNVMLYAASLAHRKRKLLLEKLRRLEAAQLNRHHDLFGPVGG